MNKKSFFYLDELHIPILLIDILKNSWLAVLAAIVACIGVFTYGEILHQPVYTTETTFAVSPRSNGSYIGFYSSLSTATEMAGVFDEVFSSDVLERIIREDLQDPDSSFSISASVAKGTNILRVSAQSDSPEISHAVMQSVLKNYGRVSGYLFGSVVLDVLKNPQIATTPSNPYNIKRFTAMAVLLAVFFMVALIAALSVLRLTVKTLSCAKRRMDDAPLGVLPKEKDFYLFRKRVKKAHLITDMSTSFQYTEALLQLAHNVRRKMQKNGMKVLLVTSVSENEGKSTISANLALALSKHGYKVAYVDMDLRKPAVHKIFKSATKEDLMSCLEQGGTDRIDASKRLHIFSNDHSVSHADKLLHSEKFVKFLEYLRDKKDFVIMDSPPYTAVADTGMLLKYADCCVMVVRQDWVPFGVCKDVAEDLNESKADYLGYIVNHYLDNGTAQVFKERYTKYGYYRKKST